MSKPQKNFRISVQTQRELDWLKDYTGDTQTNIISRAITQLFDALQGKKKMLERNIIKAKESKP